MSAYDEGSVSRVESTENIPDGVDQLPSGRYRIRWRDGGRRKSKVFDTLEEAQRVLNAVRYVLWERYQSAQSQPKEVTLRTHGAGQVRVATLCPFALIKVTATYGLYAVILRTESMQ
jgi:hypothetical protein